MKKLWLILLSAAVITSCKNGGDDGGTIDPPGDNVVITVTETSVQNVYTVSANLEASAQLRWDLGNGSTATGNNVTAKYPFKGDYTITLTYKSPTTYETLTKTKSLTVATDNPNLVESLTPEGILLSGGLGMPDGKTWVLDSLTYGHLGTGQESSYEAGDWNAGEMDKKGEGYYNQSMTFKPDYGFTLKNNGITWGGGSASEAEMAARGAVKITDIDDEWTARKYTYTPGTDWKWQFVTEDGKNYINFANNTGFLIYFRPGPHKYEILTLNENELHVRQKAGNAGDGVALYMNSSVKASKEHRRSLNWSRMITSRMVDSQSS